MTHVMSEANYLAHYGIIRRSGRYPWGSGGNVQYGDSKTFLDYVSSLESQGLTEVEVAKGIGMSTGKLRDLKAIAKSEEKRYQIAYAQKLKDKGMSNVAIGERLGIGESQVRNLLAPGAAEKASNILSVANMLKEQVEQKKMIDVGGGNELYIGVSEGKLKTAITALETQGYKVHYVKVRQLGTGKDTTQKVLTKDNMTYSEVYKNRGEIKLIHDVSSEDGGRSFSTFQPPLSISSKRLQVNYKETGGDQFDGVIYVRPGKDDISLGGVRYAQVRIKVDGTHYIKGMAMYRDDLPDGVDLVFNTNKSATTNKLDALKPLKDDPDLPFGSVVRQIGDRDSLGRLKKVTSAMNVVNEEGTWDKWSKSISTQVLSKQEPKLAKEQLDLAYDRRRNDLNEILALTNPTVRRKLLEAYADGADSAAVHMKAAALPRQRTQVILPLKNIRDNEIYAPNFTNGESVVLIRYPHGGKFEIPQLKVNNRNVEGKKLLGQAKDAVGINANVAARLSGADFDGDTVLVIPNNLNRIKTQDPLDGLSKFDPMQYKLPDSAPRMTPTAKQHKMGDISNLITDMTIGGAKNDELARAVRHSMVVIDAEKHHLDFKRSAEENGILALKKKYQGVDPVTGKARGSSTLISRASSPVRVNERKQTYDIDPKTGKKTYRETGASYVNRDGITVRKTTESKRLAETDDAATLSSGTTIERVYVNHSNRMKSLANEARREMVAIKATPKSRSAEVAYAPEVRSLNDKLITAQKNRPLERQAQVLANAAVAQKVAQNPEMDKAELKKVKNQALAEARARTGAGKRNVVIEPREWAAIQAGAISDSRLRDILNNTDTEKVKELAQPRTPTVMTSVVQARAQAMLARGFTQAEVADQLGIGLTTLKNSL